LRVLTDRPNLAPARNSAATDGKHRLKGALLARLIIRLFKNLG
jgi:hypothetical protein